MSTVYFAYGTNLNSAQLRRHCPSAKPVGRATLPAHKLVFSRHADDWSSGVLGIEPSPTHHVEGALYEIPDAELPALDDYEGVPQGDYTRGSVLVTRPDGATVQAMTYFAVPQPGRPFLPSAPYLTTIIEGAVEHQLSEEWIAWLRRMVPKSAPMR